MNKSLKLSLKTGDKIYINGAVLRVDRKVTLELMNEAHFLLAQHIMKPEETDTPLKQLYFIVQTMLIDPPSLTGLRRIFDESLAALNTAFENPEVLAGLERIGSLVRTGRTYEALKTLRKLFPIEAGILAGKPAEPSIPTAAVVAPSIEEIAICK